MEPKGKRLSIVPGNYSKESLGKSGETSWQGPAPLTVNPRGLALALGDLSPASSPASEGRLQI